MPETEIPAWGARLAETPFVAAPARLEFPAQQLHGAHVAYCILELRVAAQDIRIGRHGLVDTTQIA
jgi:hypothetical protein